MDFVKNKMEKDNENQIISEISFTFRNEMNLNKKIMINVSLHYNQSSDGIIMFA